MRHDIRIEGFAFLLRPIELGDAELIVSLRGDRRRAPYLHAIEADADAQAKYLQDYLERPGDCYFVIERRGGGPEGLVAIYDVDAERHRGEWGRWVIRPDSLAAVESAWLIYRVGFEQLGLEEIYCYTLVENAAVVSFHDKSGLERAGLHEGLVELEGVRHDAIEHRLTRERWREVSTKLEQTASGLAERLNASR